MTFHITIASGDLLRKIRLREICFGGNARDKIYGRLSCSSGKRLKKANKVFFATETEARLNGFRPCANCLRKE